MAEESVDTATPVVSEPPAGVPSRTRRVIARVRPRVALAVVAVLLLAVVGTVWWTQRGLPGDVVVRAGDTDVSETELHRRMATLEALYGVTAPDAEKDRERFWRDAAHAVAVGLVLSQAAEDLDVTVSGNQVDQALQQVITSFFGGGEDGDAAFAAALATAGTSEDAVRDELRRQLEINGLFSQVTGDVATPDDAAVEAAYADRRCSLRLPERRRIRNIVVTDQSGARDALRRLRRGADFGAVVAALSIDASTRETDGDLGLVAASELEDAYAEAAFGVAEGQLFGPVRSEFGWNVGRVESIRVGMLPSLAEARDGLRRTLFTEAQSDVWREWLSERLEQADVEYAESYAPEDPLRLPADGLTGIGGAPTGSDAQDC